MFPLDIVDCYHPSQWSVLVRLDESWNLTVSKGQDILHSCHRENKFPYVVLFGVCILIQILRQIIDLSKIYVLGFLVQSVNPVESHDIVVV